MAKHAAKATADTLAADDLLEVIAFDSQPTRIVRMTPAKHRARIQSDIARIQAGGGTEIFSALDAAYQALSTTRREEEARHPAHRRPGAAERHPRPRAGDGGRGHHRDDGRPRRRRRREPAPHDLGRRRRPLLQGPRPAVAAAHLHARDRDGEPLGRGRGVLPAAGRRRPPTSCAASTWPARRSSTATSRRR